MRYFILEQTYMALPSKQTRSLQTQDSYRRRSRDLVRRCREELGLHPNEDLDYRRFVGWLILHKPEWARTTWRQYKAAAAFTLMEKAEEGSDTAQEALEALMPVDVDGCKQTSRSTSATKLKKMPLRDYRSIDRFLEENPGPWHEDLRRWLASGMLTGLRPLEWGQTTYTTRSGEDALVVKNAKNTNKRSHGPTRTILLGGLTDEERKIIKRHVERATEWSQADQYPRFYHGCAATLSRVARRLWPKRDKYPTLYSARHQFSADAKASGLTSAELAALMGHAVDVTAGRHYGRRSAGLEMLRVRPDPSEVAKIRLVMQRTLERSPNPTTSLQGRMKPLPPGAEAGDA